VQHQIDHCDANQGFAGLVQDFVVLAQASIARQPAECSLIDPEFAHAGESGFTLWRFVPMRKSAAGFRSVGYTVRESRDA